jgi:hypothetical protein
MAILHRATVTPTKLELLETWLPRQPWFSGPATDLVRVAGYRFDDPDGEVGLETLLVRSGEGGTVYQVPLSYRGEPLSNADSYLVGTMEHSVLGPRWVYDAEGDPVYQAVLASVISGEAAQAEEFVETQGKLDRRDTTMDVTGSGTLTGMPVIVRRLGDTGDSAAGLVGTWDGQADPVTLVIV